MMNTKLVNDLELYIELEELKKFGLTDEEIEGYLDFYYTTWAIAAFAPIDKLETN